MKFDVVIGNPPYNDGIYIDFCKFAQYVNCEFCSYIIPSAFISKCELNSFTKHIDKIVNFVLARDVFNIRRVKSGVLYFKYKAHYIGDCAIVNVYPDNVVDILNRPISNIINNKLFEILNIKNDTYCFVPDMHKYFVTVSKFSQGAYDRNKLSNPVLSLKTQKHLCDFDAIIYSSDDIDMCNNFAHWYHNQINEFIFNNINMTDSFSLRSSQVVEMCPCDNDFSVMHSQQEYFDMFHIPVDIQNFISRYCLSGHKLFNNIEIDDSEEVD